MVNNTAAIDTDRAISDILVGNFSEDYIKNMTADSMQYKFRPFNTRMPNFPSVLENKFNAILRNAPSYREDILRRRNETYHDIIDTICNAYHLRVTQDIPEEQLYTVCYLMYVTFVSEFTERMINLFITIITNNMIELINHLPEDKRTAKTTYAKKMYTDPNHIILYDNMKEILDIVTTLDINFNTTLSYLTDPNTYNLLSNYLEDCGDIYKYYYATYLLDPSTRSDMITIIKLRMVETANQNKNILTSLFTD